MTAPTFRVLSIAKDFSPTPGARTPEEGPFSGEEFLKDHLTPAFDTAVQSGEKLIVDLDGTEGYATSFLEAAFGGLVRTRGRDEVLATVEIRCTDEPFLVDEAMKYIREAKRAAA